MAKLETLPLPDEIKFLQYGHLNNHHQGFDHIAECRLNFGNSSDLGLKNGAHPQQNLTNFKGNSDSVNSTLALKFGCLGLSDSRVLIDRKDDAGMDLVGKEGHEIDLEAGREMYVGVGAFWGSARKFIDRFMPGDYGQSFDGSIGEVKRIQPTFSGNANLDMGKNEENRESKVAIPKSNCKNEENQRITKCIEPEKLRKHSNKRPPRPPRPSRLSKETTDPSQEDLMKAMLRRARLERISHLKEKQIAKPKSSNSSAWALAFTLCFCFVLIFQGIFSQVNGSVQISPEAAVQESTPSVHKYVNHATKDKVLVAMEGGNLYHVGHAMDKGGTIESDQMS